MTIYLHRPIISLFNFYYFFCCSYHILILMDVIYKTCKLSLPPFLVVKTNVGYSVIAEFVIQHKDTESISEALGHLQWHWSRFGITVNAFMIDYQKSEELQFVMCSHSQKFIYVTFTACSAGTGI